MTWLPTSTGMSRGRRVRRCGVLLLSGLILGLFAANLRIVLAPVPVEMARAANTVAADGTELRVAPESCEPIPLADRAALVLVVGMPGVTAADHQLVSELMDLGVGGLLITKSNVRTREQVTDLVEGLREEARWPLLLATDEEPGRVSSFGELLGRSPSARSLARRLDPGEVQQFAWDLGRQLAAFGITLDLAPVADMDGGPAAGVIGDRSFSMEPESATVYSRSFAEGLARAGVAAAVKHFPGHGLSRVDSHRELATVEASLAELRRRDLVPFAAHIRAGVPVVMMSHVAYRAFGDDLPASLSPAAYALLREMGFAGVALTDSVGMGAIHQRWDFHESAVLAVAAGADAVLATDGRHATRMREALVAAVDEGALPEHRLTEAAARMLRLLGLDPLEVVCFDVPAVRGPLSPSGRVTDTSAS